MANLAFVDIETTGLDPNKHQIIEIAILTEPFGDTVHISVPFNPGLATNQALMFTKYYERQNALREIRETREDAAQIVFDTMQGHVFVANNPQFDAAFLTKLLKYFDLMPPWHYHLVDIKALAGGALGIAPPWTTDWLAEATEVEFQGDAHTALVDATWVRDVYKSLGLKETI